jgi:hypothetical protein
LIAAVASAVGLITAPAIDRHKAWLNYKSLAGTFAPAHVATFDWSQRYGPLNWARTGQEVLRVHAPRPDYWKAENLDLFDGTRWVQGLGTPTPGPTAAALARWTQTLSVTIRGMRTSDVVAAGFATTPQHVPGGIVGGQSPGTWTAGAELGPGDSYTVSSYSPRPSQAELAATGTNHSPELNLYRAIMLPATAGVAPGGRVAVAFAPFHSRAPAIRITDVPTNDGESAMRASPYAGAYALARRLARTAPTPLAYVNRVSRYLANGFTYSESAPTHKYPLESFLLHDKLGYCQQFSGAMALLLRMGGVPARVAAGFSSGTYNADTHEFVVRDYDAHAWVEAWFPQYGWVPFDPTPGAAPARGGHVAIPAGAVTGGPGPTPPRRNQDVQTRSGPVPASAAGTPAPVYLAVAVLLVIAAFAAAAAVRLGAAGGDRPLAELERALARAGRPLAPGTTLAQLEHRVRSSPDAAGYVRALRMARYGGVAEMPTAAQRRALRARLAEGLGWSGRLRALWALPPRAGERKFRSTSILN